MERRAWIERQEAEFEILKKLIPNQAGVECPLMQAAFIARGFDRPTTLARSMHARLATPAARTANTTKWEPVLRNVKTRKQPCGTGWRPEYTKHLSAWNVEGWAILFESIESRSIPEAVRILLASPFVMQLLKHRCEIGPLLGGECAALRGELQQRPGAARRRDAVERRGFALAHA